MFDCSLDDYSIINRLFLQKSINRFEEIIDYKKINCASLIPTNGQNTSNNNDVQSDPAANASISTQTSANKHLQDRVAKKLAVLKPKKNYL